MAFIAVDKNEEEWIYTDEPVRCHEFERWQPKINYGWVYLPKGTIEKLIGKKLTWEDEPVELKEQIGFAKGGYIENSHVYAGVIKC